MARTGIKIDSLDVYAAGAVARGRTQDLPRRMSAEEDEQIMLFEWVRTNHYRRKELFLLYYIPNVRKQPMTEMMRFARLGVLGGIPNLHLPVARQGAHSLYIELKPIDRSPSQLQIERAIDLVAEGNCVAFAWGWEMAREVLVWYLGGKNKVRARRKNNGGAVALL